MADDDSENTGQDEREPEAAEERIGKAKSIAPRSFWRGLRDTAAHMLSEARTEANRAKDDAWQRYESKTKRRRDRD